MRWVRAVRRTKRRATVNVRVLRDFLEMIDARSAVDAMQLVAELVRTAPGFGVPGNAGESHAEEVEAVSELLYDFLIEANEHAVDDRTLKFTVDPDRGTISFARWKKPGIPDRLLEDMELIHGPAPRPRPAMRRVKTNFKVTLLRRSHARN